MNDRLKELERQAYVEVTRTYRDPQSGYEQEETVGIFSREKFAELIVKECVKMVDQDGDAVMAMRMLKHFGVDE
jgi:hypothetical protein